MWFSREITCTTADNVPIYSHSQPLMVRLPQKQQNWLHERIEWKGEEGNLQQVFVEINQLEFFKILVGGFCCFFPFPFPFPFFSFFFSLFFPFPFLSLKFQGTGKKISLRFDNAEIIIWENISVGFSGNLAYYAKQRHSFSLPPSSHTSNNFF